MNGLSAALAAIGTELFMGSTLLVFAGIVVAMSGRPAVALMIYGGAAFGNAAGNLAFAVSYALTGDWPEAVVSVALAAAVLWFWRWLRRKRKDRAPRALGDESRLLVAALVRKVRQVAKPRPVLRPAPGGVR